MLYTMIEFRYDRDGLNLWFNGIGYFKAREGNIFRYTCTSHIHKEASYIQLVLNKLIAIELLKAARLDIRR